MDWSEYQKELTDASGGVGLRWSIIEAIATCAVELAAARDGTMTAEMLRHRPHNVTLDEWIAMVREHIATLGARNAVLEAEIVKDVNTLMNERNETRVEVEHLRERLSAAEEGNREIVRRAQQAEALLEREQESARMWSKRAIAAVEERDELKARCANLSAAGQRREWGAPESIDTTLAATGEYIHRITVAMGLVGHEQKTTVAEYPCSPTCTHDDAAKPGHPERVKERSEAVKAELNHATERSADWHTGYTDGYDTGAEAMRAACLEAGLVWLQERGASLSEQADFKSAIEGAVP